MPYAPLYAAWQMLTESECASLLKLPDHVLTALLQAPLNAKDLAALRCASHASGRVVEAAARCAARARGWPHDRITTSWLVALRLCECTHALPCGRTEGLLLVEFDTHTLRTVHCVPQALGGDLACASCGLRGQCWLNLGTGALLCGRRQRDGSGGNGHALAAFESSAALPDSAAACALKAGTLFCDLKAGLLTADVFSYSSNSAVLLNALPLLLAHLWIDPTAHNAALRAPTMAQLAEDLRRRFHDAVRVWFAVETDEGVEHLLYHLGPVAVDHLWNTFEAASREHYDALRRRVERMAGEMIGT